MMKIFLNVNILFCVLQKLQILLYFKYLFLTEIPATEPPQLPGRCPETEHSAWIPFHGHCYYIESSYTRNWGQASLECLRMGKCHIYSQKIPRSYTLDYHDNSSPVC